MTFLSIALYFTLDERGGHYAIDAARRKQEQTEPKLLVERKHIMILLFINHHSCYASG